MSSCGGVRDRITIAHAIFIVGGRRRSFATVTGGASTCHLSEVAIY